jgi:phospho-N-acetylmuramoyl-pentapeptide-transferase
MATAGAFAILGFIDDRAKSKRGRGLPARSKFLAQLCIAGAIAIAWQQVDGRHELFVPWVANSIALAWFALPFTALVLVAASNAVNLTDGLDGLASGTLVAALIGLGVLLGCGTNPEFAVRLGLPVSEDYAQLLLIDLATLGAVVGFLRFNRHPARVFLGDTGSLALGGLLGWIAIAARLELVLLLLGGVFVAEAASVILQVGWFKLRQRRIFRCAPLHHHFQLLGWTEPRVVARFHVAAMVCVAVTLASFAVRLGVSNWL